MIAKNMPEADGHFPCEKRGCNTHEEEYVQGPFHYTVHPISKL
jgi:hypothetical protein